MLARAATSLRLRALDARDRLAGRADPLVPPRRRWFVGGGDFVAVGDEFLGHFTELADLQPGDRVLDVGCGIGRMARPLAGFLDPATGRYDGFDVDARAIAWCQKRYRALPHFHFRAADVSSGMYAPAGRQDAGQYRFPYDDAAFDLVTATSVFTHLLEPAAVRYIAECARVLAPGGRLFATFFLLDDESRAMVARQEAWIRFPDASGHIAILDPGQPEAAIGYDRGWLGDRLTEHGLTLDTVERGSWTAPVGRSYQDIVVARR